MDYLSRVHPLTLHEFRAVAMLGNSADFADFGIMRSLLNVARTESNVRHCLYATCGLGTSEFCEFIGIDQLVT